MSDIEQTAWAQMAREVDSLGREVGQELADAMAAFPPMRSAHEGFAILKEEADELWDEVKAKQGSRDVSAMRREAIQVAAMAMRFIIDVCDGGRGDQ